MVYTGKPYNQYNSTFVNSLLSRSFLKDWREKDMFLSGILKGALSTGGTWSLSSCRNSGLRPLVVIFPKGVYLNGFIGNRGCSKGGYIDRESMKGC